MYNQINNFLLTQGANIFFTLISNLIVTFVLAVMAFIILLRNKIVLLRNFGLSNSHPEIEIYTSRIEIKPHGTTGFEKIKQGSVNTAVNALEYKGAIKMRDLFRASLLMKVPHTMQELLKNSDIHLRAIDPQIKYSPLEIDSVDKNKNLILLGNGIYNMVAGYYLGLDSSYFAFTKRNNVRMIKIKKGRKYKGRDIFIKGRSQIKNKSVETAIIERIKDYEYKTIIYLCAGLSSAATYAAAKYLATNWQKLYRAFGDKDYGIVIGIRTQNGEHESGNHPDIIFTICEGEIVNNKFYE